VARLFKPKYPRMRTVTLPDGTKRREPVRDRKGRPVYRESRKWYIEYRDASGKLRRVPGFTDKFATEQWAAELERRAERERLGIIEVSHENLTAPIQSHLDDWLADLERQNRSPEYIRKVRSRIERLCKELHWVTLASIRPDALTRWVSRQIKAGLGDRTANHYIEAALAFCNWCVGERRLESNPLRQVKRIDKRDMETRKNRRALTEDELRRLLKVAPPYRRIVYLTAALTGLRRKELRLLQWGDLHLEGDCPYIQLRAKTTKAKRDDSVSLPLHLAEALAAVRPADWQPEQPVFEKIPKITTFHKDLEKAGIPRVTKGPDGKTWTVDFHALRTTFGTMAGKIARSVSELMEALRVTDPKLATQTYNDLRLVNAAGLANRLPDLTSGDTPETAAGARTGTDDEPARDISEYISDRPAKQGVRLASIGTSAGAARDPGRKRRARKSRESERLRPGRRGAGGPSTITENWRRGESNPRPGTFQTRPLRA